MSRVTWTRPPSLPGSPGLRSDVPLVAWATRLQHQDGGVDDNAERRAAQLHRRSRHRCLVHRVLTDGVQHVHRHHMRGVSPWAGWASLLSGLTPCGPHSSQTVCAVQLNIAQTHWTLLGALVEIPKSPTITDISGFSGSLVWWITDRQVWMFHRKKHHVASTESGTEFRQDVWFWFDLKYNIF